jgi:hypothetical protein
MNATEILEPHLVPFIYSLLENPEDYQTAEAISYCKTMPQHQKEYGITHMDWLPSSPDLNPIENIWALLNARLGKR